MKKPFTTSWNTRCWRFAVVSVFFLSCALGSGVASEHSAASTYPAQPQHLDSIARLLAGLVPSHVAHADLAGTKVWHEHSRTMQKSWSRVREGQLAAMQTWRAAQLPKVCPIGSTLFYPFGGPDILNAYTLFPECDKFVLFGLEPIGEIPNPVAMKPPEFAQLLADVRGSMINLFARNYFVTTTMKKRLQTDRLRGVLPVLMISMVLSGAEVVGTAPAPFPHMAGKKHDLDGIAIDFLVPGSTRIRRVIFYSLDASDKGLADYPDFLTYLRGLTPTTTLIKSASYLLHMTEFRKMRRVLLDISAFLVQDDTGLPYDQLIKRGWNIRPYGRYQVPIPPFETKYQPTLAAAFDAAKTTPLPFRFGYHTSLAENRSNVMVGRRSLDVLRQCSDR